MDFGLNAHQKSEQTRFRAFVDREILPHADRFDREERLPGDIIGKLAAEGYLSAVLPADKDGMDPITYGVLHEEIGRGCSSVRSLLTVIHMVMHSVFRWGSRQQKEELLPKLKTGALVGAFALTEPQVGSDAGSIQTTAHGSGAYYILNGRKKWITCGQIADVFLVFARCEGAPVSFLVERNSPGLAVDPITGMLGVRASMLAELRLENCRVPADSLVGKIGFGFSHVASSALDYGRYSVAWGCVGIAQACLEACIAYTNARRQFGKQLKDHQLIQRMVADIYTNAKAARLLCLRAGHLRERNDPSAIMETMVAKYFASTTATTAALDAVQIHGAVGCSNESSVQRYMRDAKIMEIIEGSSQIQQVAIAQYADQSLAS